MERPNFSTRLSVDSPTYTSPSHESFFEGPYAARSRSSKPARSPAHSHNPSSSSTASSAASRRSRRADLVVIEGHADNAATSPFMLPTPSRPLRSPRSSLSHSRCESSNSDTWSGDLAMADDDEDFDTPRLGPGVSQDQTAHHQLPEPAMSAQPSFSESEKRKSVSSIYSLASARGVPSSAASANGSDPSLVPRSVSGLANVTIGTSSNSHHSGHGSGGGHHLAPRDSHQAHHEMMKRSTTASRTEQILRPQPNRSRSRAKRRFSGSTNAGSSHSPSSDRVAYQKEKEEAKPARWGVIGVCALDIKARSKASRNILNRLILNREFDVIVFGDKVILDEQVENWPVCDYLISFYSDGFPLEKAIAYVKTRRPFCVNDVPMQQILWDRRLCLTILDKVGVPTPQRLEVTRDGGPKILTAETAKHIRDVSGIVLEPAEFNHVPAPRKVELLDDGDVLSIDGALLKKPFVEKPISGEDHNIIIYFSKTSGGGARKLFRKIGNKSSEFVPDLTIPRAITEPDNSYIYEKFMQVDNAEDVKAYTVGPNYCHAETRKSPVVDGLVRRNTHGKELRYVTALVAEEKEIASKISTAFGQRVCGFDFLRAGGKSYVIDVNGWSFVKDNDDYYDHCANILKDIFIKEKLRRGGITPPIPSPTPSDVTDPISRAMSGVREKDGQPAAGSASSTKISQGPTTAQTEMLIEGLKSPDSPSSASASGQKSETGTDPKLQGVAIGASHLPGTSTLTPAGGPSKAPSPASTADSMLQDADIGENQEPPPPLPKHSWKLKGIVSVIRHADRTPKQKQKFTFHTEPFIELLMGHQEEVLLIGEAALASVLQAVDIAMKAGIEDRGKLKALRNVLVKKGGWAGTKVQIKPMFRKKKTDEMKSLEETSVTQSEAETAPPEIQVESNSVTKEYQPRLPPRRHDSLSGVTMSRITAAENSLVLDKLQLIVKWGGEPTHSARYQSQELGENMRNDFMLLNRDVLDEVHVYSSSERRVTTSAQIWAATFLHQKDLPEDFITIRKDLLDDSNAAKDEMDKVKKKLKGLLRKGNERPSHFTWPENMPEPSEVQTRVVQLMNFHRRVMQYNYGRLYNGGTANLLSVPPNSSMEKLPGESSTGALASSLSQANAVNSIQTRWCCGEDAELFRERWEKLFAEFCDGDKIDPSKISELYDTMKFDALHNRQFMEWVFTAPKGMLEEEYGPSKDSRATSRESREPRKSKEPEEGKSSEDSKGERSHTANSSDKLSEKIDGGHMAASVKRIFRRRSFLNNLRHSGDFVQADQIFHLSRDSSQTKTKADASLEPLRELYQLAKVLFDFICPQEYGISEAEKLEIGLLTSLPLLKEIVQDLEEMQSSNDAKSFFYFTKESHIYTLLNCILEGGIETKLNRRTIPALDYLSQICFELYESRQPTSTRDEDGGEEPAFAYSIRITISPGCHVIDPLDVQLDSRHCISCAPRRSLTSHADWMQVIQTLRAKFHQVKLPKSFLAVNLSEAFSFESQERPDDEDSFLEMRHLNYAAASEPEDDELSHLDDIPAGTDSGKAIDKTGPS